MASLLKEWIDVIPLGWAVVVIAAAIMVFELVVLVMAISRRRGSAPLSLKVHAVAGAMVWAVPVACWFPVQAARGMMIVAYSGHVADPSMTATWLSRGLDGQILGILLAAVATLMVALPWFAGLAITLRELRSVGRGRSVLPVVLIGAGLLPLAVGVIRWGIRVNNALDVLAGVDPSMKRAFVEPPLTVARAELALSARVSTIAIAILAVLAAISVVRGRRSNDGAPSRGSARRSIALATAAVALAAWLIFAARPAVAENDLPWPPRTNWALFARQGPSTPDVVGPDAPDRAPLVEVFRDRVAVEGSGVRMYELEESLGVLHHNFTLLRPNEAFDGLSLIQADQATPIADLASVLRALRGVQYDRPILLFVAKKAQDRPVLGRLETSFVTGARFKIAYADDADGGAAGDWKNAVQLRLRDFADYGAFARRLVELRTAGKPVLVKVERSDR